MSEQFVTLVNTKPSFRRINLTENGTIKPVKLEPGANLIPLELYNRLESIKHVKNLIARGYLRKEDAPKADKGFKKGDHVGNISDLKVADALAAIRGCEDVSVLKKWAEQDGRKTVKEALLTRHEELVKDEEPSEEDQETEE